MSWCVPLSWKRDGCSGRGFMWQKTGNIFLQISTISWQMVIPMILFLRISIGPIWVRNWRKNPTQALMLPLMKNSRWKRENIRRPRNIMTVFSRELRQNPCLFLTAQERLLREDTCRCLWIPESLWYFLPARSWGLLQTFCLQVYSAFSWADIPIPRKVFLQLFIMEEMIPDWRIQSACL